MLSLMTMYKNGDLFCINFQNVNLVTQKVSDGKLLEVVHLPTVSLKNVDLTS